MRWSATRWDCAKGYVEFIAMTGRWDAYLVPEEEIHIGSFDIKEEAQNAVESA